MAYAKTTPAQVIAQLVIGAGVGALAWKSVRRDEITIAKELEQKKIPSAEALEAEARATTTGKIWSSTESVPESIPSSGTKRS